MTIHTDHPFADPDPDPVRRLRGRLGGRVSLWTSGTGADRAGLTVSSLLVATGEPGHVLGLLDPDSDLAETLLDTGVGVVHLLDQPHRDLAEAFAGLTPAPGGPFRLADWEQTAWGPRLLDAGTWAGVRVAAAPQPVGWSVLVDAVLDHVVLDEDDAAPLHHRRGRYVR